MQSKDFNLALKFYEAAINWQPGKKELWEGLANAACNLGALKEVGQLSALLEHNKSHLIFSTQHLNESLSMFVNLAYSRFKTNQIGFCILLRIT